jgi:hypothetical protein
MVETDRSWISWKDRIAFADYLLDSEQLLPDEDVTPERKRAIAITVCRRAESIPGLGRKWSRERRHVPLELYDELRFKLEQERCHLAMAKQRKRRQKELLADDGTGRSTAESTNGNNSNNNRLPEGSIMQQSKKLRQENWRLNRMLGHIRYIEHTQFYATTSVCTINRALAGLTGIGSILAVFCQDVSFIVLTALSVSPAILLGYLVAKLQGRPGLPLFTLYTSLVAFCYLIYAIMRTLFYNYGEGEVKNALVIVVWTIATLLMVQTALAITLYSMRKTVRRYQIHRVLPRGGLADHQQQQQQQRPTSAKQE